MDVSFFSQTTSLLPPLLWRTLTTNSMVAAPHGLLGRWRLFPRSRRARLSSNSGPVPKDTSSCSGSTDSTYLSVSPDTTRRCEDTDEDCGVVAIRRHIGEGRWVASATRAKGDGDHMDATIGVTPNGDG